MCHCGFVISELLVSRKQTWDKYWVSDQGVRILTHWSDRQNKL